jgi:hypothetical protein
MKIRMREKVQPTVEVVQWFKAGDHPNVKPAENNKKNGIIITKEGIKVVRPGEFIVRKKSGSYLVMQEHVLKQLYEEVS